MKLLDKKTVAQDLAAERKRQIDEGINLAKKIDTLRDTLGKLEAQHQKFLSGMEIELKRTTEGLQEGIAAKKKELVEIEFQRERIIASINNEALTQIEQKTAELKELKELIDKKNIKADERLRRAEEIHSKVKARERELIRLSKEKI